MSTSFHLHISSFFILVLAFSKQVTTVTYQKWLDYDETKTIDDKINIPVQINGKLKQILLLNKNKIAA